MKHPALKYGSPYHFTPWQRIQLFFLPPIMAFGLKRLVRLCTFEIRGEEHFWRTYEDEGRVLCAIWHESLGLAGYHHQGIRGYTLTSYSFDGELAARTVSWFALGAVRGSSSRGGSDALEELEKALELVPEVGWTLDGPRGPRRVAKPGIAILAARAGISITLNAYAMSRCWRLNSWDRFPIPKPFGHIICAFAPPIPPPANESPEAIEATRRAVETALNTLHKEIEKELGDEQVID